MKLEKAIEINTLHLPIHRWPPNPDLQDAMKLGIEALKRITDAREIQCFASTYLLPGETED